MNLTHLDQNNRAHMVDISHKDKTYRVARASGTIKMNKKAFLSIKNNNAKKGPVLNTAVVAAILGSKKTSELIPMCHNINLSNIHTDIIEDESNLSFKLMLTVKCFEQTGAEMEALTGVSIGLLTIYDMVKALDKTMVISNIQLEHKEGGKSGNYTRD